jgi:S-DNA-T family DNA segregation ATPase FtsK/SpoIIIE
MTEPMTPPGGELDQGGELVPFPAPRDDDQAHETESRTAPEPDDDAVPVDPPALPLSTLGPVWERPTDRRPVLPGWLTDGETRRMAFRWAFEHATHVAAYHAVRVPLYCGRLATRSPRGLGRTVVAVGRWTFDAESAGLRRDANWRGEPREFVKLLMRRDDRVRGRLAALAFAGLGLVLVAAVLRYAAPAWVQFAAVAGTVALLGLAGRRQDRPVVGPAVVTAAPPRLTADVVVRALSSLGLAGINQAVTKGHGITFPAPIVRDGPGWRAEVDLPYGVTVADVMERRDRLASGLRRPLGCVWPEPVSEAHAGRLVLWVGDRDMNATKPPAWPLATKGRTDLFSAVPFGHDQRGRLVTVLLMFTAVLIGAMPRQGKTFALRVLLTAVALDPFAQMRVFELKGTGDLSPFEPVTHHYASGADDDAIAACVASLREVYRELDTRARTIRGLPRHLVPESKVTPELSRRKSLGLHTLVFAVDECQELFSHLEYGAEAGELATAVIKRGPALGIILILATQRPDAKSLPTGVSANVGTRFCLRVMDQTANDMVLGTSSYKAGLRATTFGPKDKGIGYLVGAADDPQIVRSAYLDGPGTERIVVRARAARLAAGTLSGHALGEVQPTAGEAASILDHILTVVPTGEGKVWSETVTDRLAELQPDMYAGWGPEQLAAALKPLGIDTAQIARRIDGRTVNRRGVDRQHIAAAVAERDRKRAAG